MKRLHGDTILVAGFLLLLMLVPAVVCAEADSGRFLLISDIHFDPFYDDSLFRQLDTQPVEKWADILEKTQPATFNRLGTDTNYALLRSSLDDARRRIVNPDFILFPGDSMGHRWQHEYDKLAKQTHLENPQAYRAFTAKAIQFVAGQFRERFPETPILPTVGNDDSLCGDYMITPEGPFLKMFADAWAPLLGPSGDRAKFRESFCKGGYYTLELPHVRRHQLVALNTVFFSIKYNNACGRSTQTPALDQLRWLDQTLNKAEAAGEKVWLLMHIPPGLNSYSSAKSVAQGWPAVTFWQPALSSRYLQIVRRYRSTLQIAFAGHVHSDDFRIIRFDGRPALLTVIVPSISPAFGNNPGYQIYDYNRRTAALENYQTYWLDLSVGGKPAPDAWASEYDFRNTYRLPGIGANTIAAWAVKMKGAPALAADYRKFYGVSAPPEFDLKQLDVYRCAILCATPAEFQACYSGIAKPKRDPPSPGRTLETVGGRHRSTSEEK